MCQASASGPHCTLSLSFQHTSSTCRSTTLGGYEETHCLWYEPNVLKEHQKSKPAQDRMAVWGLDGTRALLIVYQRLGKLFGTVRHSLLGHGMAILQWSGGRTVSSPIPSRHFWGHLQRQGHLITIKLQFTVGAGTFTPSKPTSNLVNYKSLKLCQKCL